MAGGGNDCPTSAEHVRHAERPGRGRRRHPGLRAHLRGHVAGVRRPGRQPGLRAGGRGEPRVRPERQLPPEGLRGRDVDPQRVHPDRPRQQPGPALGDLPRAVPAGRHDAASPRPPASPATGRRTAPAGWCARPTAPSRRTPARARAGCAPSPRPGPIAPPTPASCSCGWTVATSSGGGEACMPLPATPPPVTDMVVVEPRGHQRHHRVPAPRPRRHRAGGLRDPASPRGRGHRPELPGRGAHPPGGPGAGRTA